MDALQNNRLVAINPLTKVVSGVLCEKINVLTKELLVLRWGTWFL
jgi:hypothetical protein